jgi:hypothetical protein
LRHDEAGSVTERASERAGRRAPVPVVMSARGRNRTTTGAEMERRNMRVVLDLPNHTSSEHRGSSRRVAPKARRVGNATGGLSFGWQRNNWPDASGDSAWAPDTVIRGYYLHNFLLRSPTSTGGPHRSSRTSRRSCSSRCGWTGPSPSCGSTSRTGLYKDAEFRLNPPSAPGRDLGKGDLEPRYSANRPETRELYRRGGSPPSITWPPSHCQARPRWRAWSTSRVLR